MGKLVRHLLGAESFRARLRRLGNQVIGESHRGLVRALVAVVAVLSIVWLFPREEITEFSSWRAGMVAPRDVIAPFSFNVRKNDVELEQERARIRGMVPPVVVKHSHIGEEETTRLLRFLRTKPESLAVVTDSTLLARNRLNQHTIEWLRADPNNAPLARRVIPSVLRTIYEGGLLSVDDAAQLKDYFRRRIEKSGGVPQPDLVSVIPDDSTEYLWSFGRLMDRESARDNLGQMITRTAISTGTQLSPEALRALHNLVDSAMKPNFVYDRQETIRRQTRAAANVALYKRTIFKDERFVEGHAVLTGEDIDELASFMEAERLRRGEQYRWDKVAQWTGRIVIVTAVVLILGIYFREFHPELWSKPRWLILCIILIWLPLAVASFAATNSAIPIYIVPLALTATLGTVLFGAQVGLALSAGAILIAGTMLGYEFRFALVNAVAAAVAAYTVRDVRNRNQFLREMLSLPLAIAVAIAAVDATQGIRLAVLWQHVWPGAINGFSVPILAMGSLVACEKLFTITTNITLLELSDLNSPLLRDLAFRAPGTYTHSIIIANLVERGAEAIGANSLLARVGAYYHDLGKTQRADHFVENQLSNRNPHEKLSPQMSALIIAAHVKDGIEIARRAGLPKHIIDFIPQHHGTMLMTYFYRKAQKMYGAEKVHEETFRYPGPKPQTKEAAILMMADAVEASVRAEQDRTPSKVEGLVHRLVRERLDDGQFDECNLTLSDLSKIEKSFLPVLAGTLHRRIEYPKAVAPPAAGEAAESVAAIGAPNPASAEEASVNAKNSR